MNSIMGFASLLPEEENKELISQYANIIVNNSEQLVHIIDDIVLYSHLQAKILNLNVREFNVCDLLNDLKQSFNLPEYKNGIGLIAENKLECPKNIITDYEKLRQIFMNLISNAFKYTQEGTISIGAETIDNQLVFFVKDTGIGIPKAETEKVFERFFRGSNTQKDTIPGTGLGLSIVKELIYLLGGNIWIESVEGKGTTVWFRVLLGTMFRQ
jgi:signal transduction histidine kinase